MFLLIGEYIGNLYILYKWEYPLLLWQWRVLEMKYQEIVEAYQAYQAKIGDRKALYKLIAQTYHIERCLYPGSHIDIAPSLFIPEVVYVDNFKGTVKFFKDLEPIQKYIQENKSYNESGSIKFLGQDYTAALDIESVDLIISQYAGPVGQATKKYLKANGILLCNDSHGDATLARLDEEFELIGVLDGYESIKTQHLEAYFSLPRNKEINIHEIKQTMKGPKYQLQAENYLFRYKPM